MNLPPFPIQRPGVDVWVTLEIADDDGKAVCGIYQLEGKITLPPKAWLREVRAEVKHFEQIAKQAGCAEMRITGRDWTRILPDYQPFSGLKNGLRKAL